MKGGGAECSPPRADRADGKMNPDDFLALDRTDESAATAPPVTTKESKLAMMAKVRYSLPGIVIGRISFLQQLASIYDRPPLLFSQLNCCGMAELILVIGPESNGISDGGNL